MKETGSRPDPTCQIHSSSGLKLHNSCFSLNYHHSSQSLKPTTASDGVSTYKIQAPEQLGAYLRALRKSHGLTQSAIGAALGVSAARVSEIERDPATVGFGQLQKLLHLLGAQLILEQKGGLSRSRLRDSEPRGEW